VLAVLPFLVVLWLVVPEILTLFVSGGEGWTAAHLAICADVVRILCIVGILRALSYLGPPLLDGVGRPELTLRYMIVATIAVPGSFIASANLLGPSIGVESIAVAWAVGYPIAFAVLGYLVVRTTDLPLREYVRGTWGVVACCFAGFVAGLGASYAMTGAPPAARLIGISATALAVTFLLVGYWQKITPRSVARSLKG
jgi:O-antigen/teichoic acid export membrane protein